MLLYFNRKELARAGAFIALTLSASHVLAQAERRSTEEPIAPDARESILNDARVNGSAEATSDALGRGVEAPSLDVKSPNLRGLTERAVAAASCELAEPSFEVGSSELASAELRKLSSVAECLKNQDAALMWVIGEADNQGTDAVNWVLAMERAQTVKRALESMGVAPDRLIAVSAGPTGERAVSLELHGL